MSRRGESRTCAIEGCDKPVRGRGWCGTHWRRWRVHGDPTVVKVNGVDFNRKKPCQVAECDQFSKAHGYCDKHLRRWKKHGDPLHVEPIRGRPPKSGHPSWHAVHKRLARTRGPARNFGCVDCGGAAREWSYDGKDPDELTSIANGFVLRYSLDMERYEPRCVSCHRKFDGAGNRPRDSAGRFLAGDDPGVRVRVEAW